MIFIAKGTWPWLLFSIVCLLLWFRNSNLRARKIRKMSDAVTDIYQGVVCSLKENFGFIERSDVVKEIFFHYSEFQGDVDALNLGDDVEFGIQTRNVSLRISLIGQFMDWNEIGDIWKVYAEGLGFSWLWEDPFVAEFVVSLQRFTNVTAIISASSISNTQIRVVLSVCFFVEQRSCDWCSAFANWNCCFWRY